MNTESDVSGLPRALTHSKRASASKGDRSATALLSKFKRRRLDAFSKPAKRDTGVVLAAL